MKKYLLILLVGTCLASCQNDFDAEMVSTDVLCATNVGEPNTTIAAVRKQYSSAISNSSYVKVDKDLIIEGVVTGNDISGNIYQSFTIQGLTADGKQNLDEPGINIGMKGISCLYTIFPVGQKVRVNLKGLYVGGYGACPKVGQPYITSSTTPSVKMGPMAVTYLQTNIQKVGSPFETTVVPHELTSAEVTSGDISNLTPMFVVLKGVTIPDADEDAKVAYANGILSYDQLINGVDLYSSEVPVKFSDGNKKVILYTSTSADFAGEVMPEGKVNIYGILGRYSSTFQLQMRSINDIMKVK